MMKRWLARLRNRIWETDRLRRIENKLDRLIELQGEKTPRVHYCPMCERTSAFLPQGERKRPNARCPHCGSLERHRMLWHFLQTQQRDLLSRGGRWIHFAPEPALRDKLQSLPSIRYHTADLSIQNVTCRVDLQSLPFRDESYDAIICSHVLEHVPDDKKAMRDMCRILRAGGSAFVLVPIKTSLPRTYEDPTITSTEERRTHFGQRDHLRWYAMDIVDRLQDAGFAVTVHEYPSTLLSAAEAERMRITRDRVLHCMKPHPRKPG